MADAGQQDGQTCWSCKYHFKISQKHGYCYHKQGCVGHCNKVFAHTYCPAWTPLPYSIIRVPAWLNKGIQTSGESECIHRARKVGPGLSTSICGV
eukprot:g58621.t1